MMDDMLGPGPMNIKYVSYVYDIFCIWGTNFPGPIVSVIFKFACINLQNIDIHSLPTYVFSVYIYYILTSEDLSGFYTFSEF